MTQKTRLTTHKMKFVWPQLGQLATGYNFFISRFFATALLLICTVPNVIQIVIQIFMIAVAFCFSASATFA